MPGLSEQRLRSLLLGALPGAVVYTDQGHTKPIVLEIPTVGRVRVYLWTTTPDASEHGRPRGEHKAQIIIPGTPRGSQQILTVGDIPTALLGYSPLFGVFTAWEARLHVNSGYSKNLQFRGDLLESGRAFGWGVGQPRRTEAGLEVRVAVHPLHLLHYLRVMIAADMQNLEAEPRREFFLQGAPQPTDLEAGTLQRDTGATERERVMARRLRRDGNFGRMVRSDYGNACAICSLQLSIVEGAHIIPVHDQRSLDERWNGICLCPNHHELFDSRILRINGGAVVCVESEDVMVLRELNLLDGYNESLEPFIGQQIRLPGFCREHPDLHELLLNAFQTFYMA